MTEQKRKPNEPHDQFIKQFVPVVLKNLFESQTKDGMQFPIQNLERMYTDWLRLDCRWG